MVTRFRAISKRTSQNIAERFREAAADVRALAAQRIADDIVDFSPVDTGTYVMAHVASTTPDITGGGRSSHGKPQNQNEAQFKNLARANLRRSVSKEAILSSSQIFFGNRAIHASRVEWLGWNQRQAYHVYARARRRAEQHIIDAARDLGMEAR